MSPCAGRVSKSLRLEMPERFHAAAESIAFRKAGKYRSLLSVARIADMYSGCSPKTARYASEPKEEALPRPGAALTAFSLDRIESLFGAGGRCPRSGLNAQGVPLADFRRSAVL